MIGGEATIGVAGGTVGKPAGIESKPIQVKQMVVKAEASKPAESAKTAETPKDQKQPEDARKNEVKGQTKEQFLQEQRFVDSLATNLIREAKFKAVSASGKEATALREKILEEKRPELEKRKFVLLNKLSLGGQIDIQDKELLGMLEFKFPPADIIKKEGFNPVFEPRTSLTALLDYYNRVDPATVAEKEAPILDAVTRKQVTEAATHLGLITADGENGKFAETTVNIVKDIFKDSNLSEANLTELMAVAEKSIEGRVILTPSDFSPETGFLGEIGTGILTIQKKIMADQVTGKNTKAIEKEVSVLLEHQDVFMGYIKEAMKNISEDYQKLMRGQLNGKDASEWFSIFGPQVAGADQTEAINKYFGKHNLLDTLKKNRMMSLTKGGGITMGMLSLFSVYGMWQVINKKEGVPG